MMNMRALKQWDGQVELKVSVRYGTARAGRKGHLCMRDGVGVWSGLVWNGMVWCGVVWSGHSLLVILGVACILVRVLQNKRNDSM